MSAPHPVSTRPLCTPRAESLAALLRRRTRVAHGNAEKVFDLDTALADRRSYRALLRRLRGFYLPAEAALENLEGWDELDPVIDVQARGRSALLDDDLRRLDRVPEDREPEDRVPEDHVPADREPADREPADREPADRHPAHRQMRPPDLGSLAAGLGWLYVLEGSALGGQIIAGRARAALGEDLPVSFFSSAGRPTGRNWRDLQRALDLFGSVCGPVDVESAVGAATDSFERFGRWISGWSGRC